jgi:hypothetical protein
VVAGDLVALAAGRTVVEERRAQRRRPRAVALRVQVPVPARTTHGVGGVGATVECGMRLEPPGRRRRRRRAGGGAVFGHGQQRPDECEQHGCEDWSRSHTDL